MSNYGDVGKPCFRQYVISVRPRGSALGDWPMADQLDIALARRNYDQGTHIMVTSVHGNKYVLYSIPRRHSKVPHFWFSKDPNALEIARRRVTHQRKAR